MSTLDLARVIAADFEISVGQKSQITDRNLPEIVFVGRSNVGKSSLINTLCNRRQLAKTSKTPGRTALINYFRITLLHDIERKEVFFVDLPGYGYAQVAKKTQSDWAKLIENYLANSVNLVAFILLVDARRGLEQEELWFQEVYSNLNVIIALTKCDKISKNELSKVTNQLTNFGLDKQNIFATSSLDKNKIGNHHLLQRIFDLSNL